MNLIKKRLTEFQSTFFYLLKNILKSRILATNPFFTPEHMFDTEIFALFEDDF